VLSLTLHKGMTKHIIKSLAIPTPDFMVVESPANLAQVTLPMPLFAKPVAEGTGKGVTTASIINDRKQLDRVCRHLLTTYKQPVLVETYLPGREFTVAIVGSGSKARALGVVEVILLKNSDPGVYSYRNKEICEEVVEYRLVDDPEAREAARVALASWQGLGCRDGGRVDIRSDRSGQPNFIEVNPLAGLHPEHSDLCIIASQVGMPYIDLIESILAEARQRIKP